MAETQRSFLKVVSEEKRVSQNNATFNHTPGKMSRNLRSPAPGSMSPKPSRNYDFCAADMEKARTIDNRESTLLTCRLNTICDCGKSGILADCLKQGATIKKILPGKVGKRILDKWDILVPVGYRARMHFSEQNKRAVIIAVHSDKPDLLIYSGPLR